MAGRKPVWEVLMSSKKRLCILAAAIALAFTVLAACGVTAHIDDPAASGTGAPVTSAPETSAPVTSAPVTSAPGTDAPGTDAPVTSAPGTDAPITSDPGTDDPGTDIPGTDVPGTDDPGTDIPGTDVPGTDVPGAEDLSWLRQLGQNYDSFVIGDSSAAAYSVEELNGYLNARFYSLLLSGSDAGDYEALAAGLLEHCAVKNLVLSLGLEEAALYDVGEGDLSGRILGGPENEWADPGAGDRRLRDMEKIGDPDVYAAAHGAEFASESGAAELPCIRECVRSVAAIRDLCAGRGVDLIVIAAPVYSGQWARCGEAALRDYKTALAREVDFWDFSLTFASYDSRYFYDAGHFRGALGSMVLAEIFGDERVYRPEDFGALVTAETCESHVERLFSDPPAADPSDYTVDVPILLYHHVVEEVQGEHNGVAVSRETLERQLRFLAEEGYHAVSSQELIDYVYYGGALPDKPVYITFDDGYYSNYSIACPLLKEYGLKATVFAIGVSVGHMEYYKDTGYSLTPHFGYDEAREMEQAGIIEFQSHTYDMHQWPPFETGDRVRKTILPLEGEGFEEYAAVLRADLEIYGRERERELGAGFCALAYPQGAYCSWTELLVHESGIPLTLSTSTDSRNVLVRGLPQSLYALCRWYATEDTTQEQLAAILRGR